MKIKQIIFLIIFTFDAYATEKYIITGGPGVGKTSILIGLELQGERVIPEAAIDIIQWYQAQGIKEPWNDPEFEQRVLRLQVQRERQVQFAPRCIFDRSVIDGLAYCIFYGKGVDEERRKEVDLLVHNHEYKKVFLIESLGFDNPTDRRQENIEASKKLEKLIEKTYSDLGFTVIKIRPDTLSNRIEMILKSIEEQ